MTVNEHIVQLDKKATSCTSLITYSSRKKWHDMQFLTGEKRLVELLLSLLII